MVFKDNSNSTVRTNLENVECNFFHKYMKSAKEQPQPHASNESYERHQPTNLQIKLSFENRNLKDTTALYQMEKRAFDAKNKHMEAQDSDAEESKRSEFVIPNKSRAFQLDVNLSSIRNNINYSPKIYFVLEKDSEGKEMKDGDFFLVIELGAPCESFEQFHDKLSNKKVFNKCMSPFRLQSDLLNYWNRKQVFYIRGKKNPNLDPNKYFKGLVEQELI